MKPTTRAWVMPVMHTLALLPLLTLIGVASAVIAGGSTSALFLGASASLANVSTFFFTLMLACTPITILTGWRWPQLFKRPLGLYFFMYAALHFLVFSSAFGFVPAAILGGASANGMLFFGLMALLFAIPLAVTSNRWSMRTLGKRWKHLHKLVYLIAVFVIVHLLFLQTGWLTVFLYTLFLMVRVPPIRRWLTSMRTGRRSWRQHTASQSPVMVVQSAVSNSGQEV